MRAAVRAPCSIATRSPNTPAPQRIGTPPCTRYGAYRAAWGMAAGGLVRRPRAHRTSATDTAPRDAARSVCPGPERARAACGSSGARPRSAQWARPVCSSWRPRALSYTWAWTRPTRDVLRRRRPQHVPELAQLLLRRLRPLGYGVRRQAARRVLGAGPLGPALRLPHLGHGPAPGGRGALTVLVLFRAVRRSAGARRRPRRPRPGRHPGDHPAQPGQRLGLAARPVAGPGGRRRHSAFLSGRLPHLLWPASGSGWPSRPRCSRRGSSSRPSSSPIWWPRPSPACPAPRPRRLGRCSSSLVVSLSWMLLSPPSPPTTGRTSTAAATTRSSARSSSTTGPTGSRAARSISPGAARHWPRSRPASPSGPRLGGAGASDGGGRRPSGPGRFLNGMFGGDAGLGLCRPRRLRGHPRRPPSQAARDRPVAGRGPLWALDGPDLGFFVVLELPELYYLAAYAPPIAALCGMGLGLAWRLRARRAAAR